MIRIALAQIDPTVGDFEYNTRIISRFTRDARRAGVDLIVFPELAVSGYTPEDLLLKNHFADRSRSALERILPDFHGIAAIIGCPVNDGGIRNSCLIIYDGRILHTYYKQHLPNYGVFDEKRYFRPGSESPVYLLGDNLFGVSICEDIWVEGGPANEQAEGGAGLLVNISASPFHAGKTNERVDVVAKKAKQTGAYVAYCNLVGAQDELVFDGGSMLLDPSGNILARSRQFDQDLLIADVHTEHVSGSVKTGNMPLVELGPVFHGEIREYKPRIEPLPGAEEEVYKALSVGVRDYTLKNGFKGALLGLSGGIDSSLTAAIACDAIGPDKVAGVSMPSIFTSSRSLKDARALAANLEMELIEIPINNLMESYLATLSPIFRDLPEEKTEENLQARIRGNLLMALSNKFGRLVLSTGNKSETSVGYCTLYGDMAGGLAVIKDVPKTLVYRLARYRNGGCTNQPIPESVLKKEPSAELRPGQKDSDSLPSYELLDPILNLYIEDDLSVKEIIDRGYDRETVNKVALLVDMNEYKRRQSPPGIKITPKAFGKDRRMPITNRFTP